MKLQDLHEAKGKALKDLLGRYPRSPSEINLDCSNQRIFSLEGAPQSIKGFFNCDRNQLTSLVGGPQIVGGYFSCSRNKLFSLDGSPRTVGSSFYCDSNKLTSLEGAPQSVGVDFYCQNNKLTSLKDIHKQIKSMNVCFMAEGNPIKSHVIGLILIPGCSTVKLDNKKVEEILNRYLGQGRAGLVDCAEELVKAGFPEMAKL